MLLSALSQFTGFTLDTVTHSGRETKRLACLSEPASFALTGGSPS